MATAFTTTSFLLRWAFALALVIGTYNPTSFSYVSWISDGSTEFGPIPVLLGLVLLVAWIIYLRATFRSLGVTGISLGAALFGCLIWLFVDLGWLSLDSTGVITWLILVVVSLILALGMSWSHIRRRMTGQVDVDDVED